MFGWAGRILRVDLSGGKVSIDPLPPDLAFKFSGGRGLNTRFLYEELRPGIDPLGPENKIIVGTGPCNGTLLPGSTRFTMSTKSPLTGFLGDSNCGGSLGVALKYAGYDMVIIEGAADSPVYLLIDDDRAELKSAEHLWGKTTGEARRTIESEVGDPDISIACIGPAGENLVRMACLIADLGRGVGRTGVGAVFGSKNLKALAVRGSKGVKVADNDRLVEAWKEMYQAWHEDPTVYNTLAKMGQSAGMVPYHKYGILPTKNYLKGTWNEGIYHVNGQNLADWYFVKPKACFSCPVPCQHLYVVDRGPYAGDYGEGMELGQLEHFSSRIMVNDLDLVMKAAVLCNDFGIDVLEAGQFIGYVMECFDNGILTPADTDGLRIEWGSREASLQLIEMVANRRGIGDLLAEGLKTASDQIGKGSDMFVQLVKGQAVPTRDARGSKGWGLGYAVASRGADHCRSLINAEIPLSGGIIGFDPVRGEVIGEPEKKVDPYDERGKGVMVRWYEDLRGFQHGMQMCMFDTALYPAHLGLVGTLAKFYNAVVGSELNEADCLQIGERVVNLERAFNVREGLSRKDDTLPKRFLKEPMVDGPAKGQLTNLGLMLDEYYEARGWNKKTGFPTRQKLEKLGIGELADDLQRMNRLGKMDS